MIVLPKLIDDLLDQVEEKRAAHLALDFAHHVLDVQRAEIEDDVMAVCLEYLAAADEAIELGEATPRLLTAHEQLSVTAERWEGDRHLLARGAGLAVQAVRVGCQRMMEDVRDHVMRSSLITCRDVARELQAEAGRWYAKRTSGGADERLVARSARWEEARWQLQHVIATEPAPHGGGIT